MIRSKWPAAWLLLLSLSCGGNQENPSQAGDNQSRPKAEKQSVEKSKAEKSKSRNSLPKEAKINRWHISMNSESRNENGDYQGHRQFASIHIFEGKQALWIFLAEEYFPKKDPRASGSFNRPVAMNLIVADGKTVKQFHHTPSTLSIHPSTTIYHNGDEFRVYSEAEEKRFRWTADGFKPLDQQNKKSIKRKRTLLNISSKNGYTLLDAPTLSSLEEDAKLTSKAFGEISFSSRYFKRVKLVIQKEEHQPQEIIFTLE